MLLIFSLFHLTLSEEMIKPLTDKNEYRILELPNKLRAILIKDKDTTLSAVSLIVKVGSYETPKDLQGLPHLLEHALFLGSKKYPKKDTLSTFVGNNGGSVNAWTTSRDTNYYFEINNDRFEEAIDMFSDMMENPLLNPELIRSELSAVQSEFEKNKNEDTSREFRIFEINGNPRSKITLFSTGNNETLDKPHMPQKIKEFFDDQYSSNRMIIAVLSNRSLDEQEELVRKHFTSFKNKNLSDLDYNYPIMYPKDYLGKFIKVKGIAATTKLTVYVPLIGLKYEYKYGAVKYVTNCLSSGSDNSLLKDLMKEGQATAINTYEQSLSSESTLLLFMIDLTEKGESNYKDVLRKFFNAANNIKNSFTKDHFDLFKKGREIEFAYKDQSASVSKLLEIAENLPYYPLHLAIRRQYLSEFNREMINLVLTQIRPERSITFLRSKGFDKLSTIEPIYKTEYEVIRYSPQDLEYFSQMSKPGLPVSNPFIPKHLSIDLSKSKNHLLTSSSIKKIPTLQFSLPGKTKYPKVCERIHHYKDKQRFLTPKITVSIYFYSSPSLEMTPKLYLSKLFFENMISIVGQKLFNQADQAGFNYELKTSSQGLKFDVSGYSETLPVFLTQLGEVMSKILSSKRVSMSEFSNTKYSLANWLSEKLHNRLFIYSIDTLEIVLSDNYVTFESLKEELKNFTLEDFEKIRHSLFDNFCYEVLVSGDISGPESEKMIREFVKQISDASPKKLASPIIVPSQVVKIPPQSTKLLSLPSTEGESNDVVLLVFQQKRKDYDRQKMFFEIATKLLNDNFFEVLRTEMQLGYIVFARGKVYRGTPTFMFVVQGSKKNSHEMSIEARKWLAGKLKEIDSLPLSQFNSARKAVSDIYLQPEASLPAQHEQFFKQIDNHQLNFRSNEIAAKEVMTISFEQYAQWFKEMFGSMAASIEVHYSASQTIDKVRKNLSKRAKDESATLYTSIEELKRNTSRYDDFYIDF